MESLSPPAPHVESRTSIIATRAALGLTVLGLAVLGWSALQGGGMGWLSLALPAMVLTDICVRSLKVLRRWPRLENAYPWLSMAFALWFLIAVVNHVRAMIAAASS